MILYYYHFETTVNKPFWDTSYDFHEGFLMELPLGLVQFHCHDECNQWDSMEDFKKSIEGYYPRDFQIIKLRG